MQDNNRIWVPGTLEIFTENGWIPVAHAFNMAPRLVTADLEKRKVVVEHSRAWAKKSFTGDINRMTEGLLRIEFSIAYPIDKAEVLDVSYDVTLPVYKRVAFSGNLYSFDVPRGVVMLRSQFKADLFTERSLDEAEAHNRDSYEFSLGYEEPEYHMGCDALGIPDWWMSRTRW